MLSKLTWERKPMFFEIRNLVVDYGGCCALSSVSIQIEKGELVAVIGANGAGKSTLLRTISGLEKAESGEILLEGRNVAQESPADIVRIGISQCMERRRLFGDLTVRQNLLLGAYLRRDKKGIEEDLESIFEHYPILKQRSRQRASTLSGGEQQMAAVGRALMNRPKLLLLDEPSTGLAPLMVNELRNFIVDVNRKRGVTVLLVEQNVKMALRAAKRGYVLESGAITLEGSAEELSSSDAVRKAYLGI
jgi:branched-chain amino acid transport system ATP-binding protein